VPPNPARPSFNREREDECPRARGVVEKRRVAKLPAGEKSRRGGLMHPHAPNKRGGLLFLTLVILVTPESYLFVLRIFSMGINLP